MSKTELWHYIEILDIKIYLYSKLTSSEGVNIFLSRRKGETIRFKDFSALEVQFRD